MRGNRSLRASFLVTSELILALTWLSTASLARQDRQPFTEITDEVGLDFVHDPGNEGKYLAPEVMGSGGAFLDYDHDGDLDIYLIQGGPLPESTRLRELPNRLYRQNPDGTFTDVTQESGLGDTGYGAGVAVGDIDNDGLVDVYTANYGPDALYHNQGDGKFENITKSAGISGNLWSASAAFCDYDGDGLLDLYVTHYVKFDPTKVCVKTDGAPDYCSPQSFSYQSDALYHNDGGGTFTDVSRASGIDRIEAPGLSIICSDFTGDGWLDFYIANDGEANQLWENQRNGKFVDEAILFGAALNSFGRPEASMGVALGDVEGDGDLDLFMTHLIDQTNTLYLNDGNLGFADVSAASGLGSSSLKFTGFGTVFVDFDHDGDLDIAIVNGRVDRNPPFPGAQLGPTWDPYAEPNFLLENDGKGRFTDMSASAGPFASQIEVSRGLVLGDIDEDGDLDMMVTNTAGRARLFRNDAQKAGSWLQVRTRDGSGKRDAHGAIITVVAGGRKYVRIADPASSYLSSNDPRAYFGIVSASKADSITVRWPDGSEESFPGVALNRSVTLAKGTGSPPL